MATLTPEVGPKDTPPKDGKFRDWDGEQLRPEQIEAGNARGLSVVDYVEDQDGEVTVL